MSDRNRQSPDEPSAEEPTHGTNLILIYSLIALALIAAIAIALIIVYPFYRLR